MIGLSKYWEIHPTGAFYLSAAQTYSRMQLPRSYDHLLLPSMSKGLQCRVFATFGLVHLGLQYQLSARSGAQNRLCLSEIALSYILPSPSPNARASCSLYSYWGRRFCHALHCQFSGRLLLPLALALGQALSVRIFSLAESSHPCFVSLCLGSSSLYLDLWRENSWIGNKLREQDRRKQLAICGDPFEASIEGSKEWSGIEA